MESQKASSFPGWEKLEFTICSGDGKSKKGKSSDEHQKERQQKRECSLKGNTKRRSTAKGKGLAWDRMRSTDL